MNNSNPFQKIAKRTLDVNIEKKTKKMKDRQGDKENMTFHYYLMI